MPENTQAPTPQQQPTPAHSSEEPVEGPREEPDTVPVPPARSSEEPAEGAPDKDDG